MALAPQAATVLTVDAEDRLLRDVDLRIEAAAIVAIGAAGTPPRALPVPPNCQTRENQGLTGLW